MTILTLCGSLRAQSANRSILQAYERLASSSLSFQHSDSVALLPHYNPDLDVDPLPAEVARWRRQVNGSDALVLSTPEYVHALPGSFKNALDWLVSDPAFAGKPVVILHAARGSNWALDSLREVLRTMSASLVEDACVQLPLGTNRLNEDNILARDDLRAQLLASLRSLEIALIPHQRTGG